MALYVALDNATLLQFKTQITRRRGENIGRSVKRIEGFSDPKTVVLRSDKFLCMTLTKEGQQLWVSNNGHVDIVDCTDFKVIRAERIVLEILFRMVNVKQGVEIIQMMEVNGHVFCLLQESFTILEFDAQSYNIVGLLSLKEQSLYSRLVFRPVALKHEDHKAYHGVDILPTLKVRTDSNTSNTSMDSEDSEDEGQREWPDRPPAIPPRVGRESTSDLGPPEPPVRSNTNAMIRRPAIPPKPRQSMVNTLPAGVKTQEEAASFLDPDKPKLQHSNSQSLPNISVEHSEGIIATSIANVRGSLWVGRSIGDICVVDVSLSGEDNSKHNEAELRGGHSADISRGTTKTGDKASKHGKVVAVLHDINHRQRGEVDKIELLTVGNFVVSAHKRSNETGARVDFASWDAYNARDAVTVEHYWKDLLNIEKSLIEEGNSEWKNIEEF